MLAKNPTAMQETPLIWAWSEKDSYHPSRFWLPQLGRESISAMRRDLGSSSKGEYPEGGLPLLCTWLRIPWTGNHEVVKRAGHKLSNFLHSVETTPEWLCFCTSFGEPRSEIKGSRPQMSDQQVEDITHHSPKTPSSRFDSTRAQRLSFQHHHTLQITRAAALMSTTVTSCPFTGKG